MRIEGFNFSDKQIDRISDIFSDVAQVCLASVVIPAFFDRFDIIVLLSGLIAASFFWTFSIRFKK